ncbi:hypothetical protein M408DRAFT_328977 [Serendipita vermifera MAFF 305830]|uniref:Uncharacterized protein n=1 Tax=Serendipita vermifera MAFF 305830 TaxID=933852 RepID=A0A0C3BD24_SERVB|nr:hypothetical protein M408DRAFT_328977 [Serendipita vermifera MAFF 305830]
MCIHWFWRTLQVVTDEWAAYLVEPVISTLIPSYSVHLPARLQGRLLCPSHPPPLYIGFPDPIPILILLRRLSSLNYRPFPPSLTSPSLNTHP